MCARLRLTSSVVAFLILLMSADGSAQQAAGIAGVVRDTTGGVLPGVTVEAASPALIEKVRSVVTDTDGQYRIVDLRPGTYIVTFTLPGSPPSARRHRADGGVHRDSQRRHDVGALEETVDRHGRHAAGRHAERPAADAQSRTRCSRRCPRAPRPSRIWLRSRPG